MRATQSPLLHSICLTVVASLAMAQPALATDCVLSQWSAWSACSKACGGGSQSQTRSVITLPSNGGAVCGALTATQACNTQPCPVDCAVSAWSAWSACSKPCGTGAQTRSRSVTQLPSGGGAACPGLSATQMCNTQACLVDCVVSAWSAWSACSKPCGTGAQTRSRAVVQLPAGGGAACPALSATQACNVQECP